MNIQPLKAPRPSLSSPWRFDSDWDYYDSIGITDEESEEDKAIIAEGESRQYDEQLWH